MNMNCRFYKQDSNTYEWSEYLYETILFLTSLGITIRNKSNQSLICDIPIISIHKVDLIDDTIKIYPKALENSMNSNSIQIIDTQVIAIKLESIESCQEVIQYFKSNHISILTFDSSFSSSTNKKTIDGNKNLLNQNNSFLENEFPDLKRRDVQDYLLRLIINPSFQQYVNDLGKLIEELEKELLN